MASHGMAASRKDAFARLSTALLGTSISSPRVGITAWIVTPMEANSA
jgi:hypothetical protein